MGACANPSASDSEAAMAKMSMVKNSLARKSRSKGGATELHSNIFIDTFLYTKLDGINSTILGQHESDMSKASTLESKFDDDKLGEQDKEKGPQYIFNYTMKYGGREYLWHERNC